MKQYKHKLALATVLGMSVVAANAYAEEGAGKIYYKDGTTVETAHFDMKMNLLLQPNFSFTDYDQKSRREQGLKEIGDETGFDVERARLKISGDALDHQFTYNLYHDFRADGGGSELQDAWLQWNTDAGHLRVGQFNVAFSRQTQSEDFGQQFLDRSIVSQLFSPGREMGMLWHGNAGDTTLSYALGAYNGTIEGKNSGPDNNTLLYNAAVAASTCGYGSRDVEGDLREDNSTMDFTGGLAAYYEEKAGLNQFGLNGDLGMRWVGFSAQTEIFYQSNDNGDVAVDTDDTGLYAQLGYMLDKSWEVAGRFGYINPDDSDGIDRDSQSYEAVINYFISGHRLKLQTGVLWVVDNTGDDDVTDVQVASQLTGYL